MVGKVDVTISESVKHNGEVTCLAFHNDYLYSGGADGLIKVWNKDLQLIKDVPAHSAYIYAMTINSKGWVYSSSCDGTVKCFPNVLNSNNSEVIYQSNCDDIISICCNEDDIIYFGDDKGVVSQVVNSKIENQYDLVEEVKAIAINVQTLYTARNTDAVITELKNGKKTHFTTRAVIPGRAPLALIGPVENGLRRWLIFTSRDGKGVSLVQNGCKWPVLWTKDNAHDLIINTLCGTHDRFYTAGYDGKVKKWTELEHGPQIAGEVETGTCINQICNGLENTVYTGDMEGLVRRVHFSSVAA